MTDSAEVTATAALNRQESSGGRWRTDYSGRNNEDWLQHSLETYNSDGTSNLEHKDVISTKYQPTERKYSFDRPVFIVRNPKRLQCNVSGYIVDNGFIPELRAIFAGEHIIH